MRLYLLALLCVVIEHYVFRWGDRTMLDGLYRIRCLRCERMHWVWRRCCRGLVD